MRIVFFLYLFFITLFTFSQSEHKEIVKELAQIEKTIFKNTKEAKAQLDKIEKKISLDNKLIAYEFYSVKGLYYAVASDLNKALYFFSVARDVAENDQNILQATIDISIVYKDLQQYKTALKELFKAEKLALEKNYTRQLIRIYSNKSSIYRANSLYDLAIENSSKAIELCKNNSDRKYDLFIEKQKLGNIYKELKDYKFALQQYLVCIPFFENRKDKFTQGICHFSAAEVLYDLKKFKEADEQTQNAIECFKNTNKDLEALALALTAKLKWEITRDFPAVKLVFEKALILSENNKKQYLNEILISYLDIIHKANLSILFQSIQEKYSYSLKNLHKLKLMLDWKEVQFKNSLQSGNLKQIKLLSTEYIHLKDSLYQLQNSNSLKVLAVSQKQIELSSNNEILHDRNRNLEKRNKRNENFLLLIICLFILIVVVVVLLVHNFKLTKSKITYQNQILEREKLLIENENRTNIKQLQLQRDEIKRISNREIKLQHQLKELIDNYENSSKKDVSKLLSESKNYYNSRLLAFKKVNNFDENFTKALAKKHPNLTKTELEFCQLLKLNLTTKEIAEILNITSKGVFMKKYRLIKKLSLPKQENILNYLLKI